MKVELSRVSMYRGWEELGSAVLSFLHATGREGVGRQTDRQTERI